jgi:drug/metabolite transporter (DMT)-like permease
VRIESPSGSAPSRIVVAASISMVIVIWSVNFIAAKIGLRSLPTMTMASFRVVLAGVVMLPAYLLCSRLNAFAETAETRRRGFNHRDHWTFLYLGFFGVTVNQVCFTVGLRLTSVGHASVIVGMGPIYTLALAVLLRLEKATLRKATGMAIAFTGIAVMASEKGITVHSPSLLGDTITLAGSIGFAIYVVLGKRVAGKYDALTMTAFSHFAGALIVLPMAIRGAVALGTAQNWLAIPWSA